VRRDILQLQIDSIARLLVRNLVPAAASGGDLAEDIVTAQVDYSKLDQPAGA